MLSALVYNPMFFLIIQGFNVLKTVLTWFRFIDVDFAAHYVIHSNRVASSYSPGSEVHLINSRAPRGLTYGFGCP